MPEDKNAPTDRESQKLEAVLELGTPESWYPQAPVLPKENWSKEEEVKRIRHQRLWIAHRLNCSFDGLTPDCAFNELYEENVKFSLGILLKRLKDPRDAEELAQDFWVREYETRIGLKFNNFGEKNKIKPKKEKGRQYPVWNRYWFRDWHYQKLRSKILDFWQEEEVPAEEVDDNEGPGKPEFEDLLWDSERWLRNIQSLLPQPLTVEQKNSLLKAYQELPLAPGEEMVLSRLRKLLNDLDYGKNSGSRFLALIGPPELGKKLAARFEKSQRTICEHFPVSHRTFSPSAECLIVATSEWRTIRGKVSAGQNDASSSSPNGHEIREEIVALPGNELSFDETAFLNWHEFRKEIVALPGNKLFFDETAFLRRDLEHAHFDTDTVEVILRGAAAVLNRLVLSECDSSVISFLGNERGLDVACKKPPDELPKDLNELTTRLEKNRDRDEVFLNAAAKQLQSIATDYAIGSVPEEHRSWIPASQTWLTIDAAEQHLSKIRALFHGARPGRTPAKGPSQPKESS